MNHISQEIKRVIKERKKIGCSSLACESVKRSVGTTYRCTCDELVSGDIVRFLADNFYEVTNQINWMNEEKEKNANRDN